MVDNEMPIGPESYLALVHSLNSPNRHRGLWRMARRILAGALALRAGVGACLFAGAKSMPRRVRGPPQPRSWHSALPQDRRHGPAHALHDTRLGFRFSRSGRIRSFGRVAGARGQGIGHQRHVRH